MLQAHLDKWSVQVLDYQRFDCAKFVGEWAGHDFGDWDSEQGALECLARVHRKSRSIEVLDEAFGPHFEPKLAKRGDVLAISRPPLDPLGICIGREGVFLGQEGLVRVRLRNCAAAWRVKECRA